MRRARVAWAVNVALYCETIKNVAFAGIMALLPDCLRFPSSLVRIVCADLWVRVAEREFASLFLRVVLKWVCIGESCFFLQVF